MRLRAYGLRMRACRLRRATVLREAYQCMLKTHWRSKQLFVMSKAANPNKTAVCDFDLTKTIKYVENT